MIKPRTHTLIEPIDHDGEQITALTMRPPRARDVVDGQREGDTPGEVEVMIFARLTDAHPDAIGALHLIDYTALQRLFQEFQSGPKAAAPDSRRSH